jgi:PhnB protein
MTGTVKSIPEGLHSITAMIAVRDAAKAIQFYMDVFGARELPGRLVNRDGKIMHAEVQIGDSRLMIAEEQPEFNRAPPTMGGTFIVLHLYVEDVDDVAKRAVSAGARLAIPLADQFYGDRSGRIVDPFGIVWIIATHREDMSPQEMQKRAAKLFGKPKAP